MQKKSNFAKKTTKMAQKKEHICVPPLPRPGRPVGPYRCYIGCLGSALGGRGSSSSSITHKKRRHTHTCCPPPPAGPTSPPAAASRTPGPHPAPLPPVAGLRLCSASRPPTSATASSATPNPLSRRFTQNPLRWTRDTRRTWSSTMSNTRSEKI